VTDKHKPKVLDDEVGVYYVVMSIETGQFVYRGTSAGTTAARLAPGTCYAKGANEDEATKQCHVNRAQFLSRQTAKT